MFNWLHWDHNWSFEQTIYTNDTEINIEVCKTKFCPKTQIRTSQGYSRSYAIEDSEVPETVIKAKLRARQEKNEYHIAVQKRKKWRELISKPIKKENYCINCGDIND